MENWIWQFWDRQPMLRNSTPPFKLFSVLQNNLLTIILKCCHFWICNQIDTQITYFHDHQSPNLNSANIYLQLVEGRFTKSNSHQILWLYGSLCMLAYWPVQLNSELNPEPKPWDTTRGLMIAWCGLATYRKAHPCTGEEENHIQQLLDSAYPYAQATMHKASVY